MTIIRNEHGVTGRIVAMSIGTVLVGGLLLQSALAADPPAQAMPSAAAAATANANQTDRQSLLPLAQPLWSALTPAQQQVLTPFTAQWNSMPAEEKLAWVAVADRYPKMSRAEHAKIDQRIREWSRLTPDQRRQARANYRLAKQLPPDERVAQWQQYNTLTAEQKQVLQQSGSTSNTGARHAGARTALAKEAAQPLTQQPAPQSSNASRPPGVGLPASSLVPTKN